MKLKEVLGKNIQRYRKLNNLTQEKLSEIIGIEINSISSIERGKSFPSADTLEKIASALKVSVSDLFNFSDCTEKSDYISEITSNLKLIERDNKKLSLINDIIKKILMI